MDRQLAVRMRAAHEECNNAKNVASASLLEGWIDEAEHRTWFLFEAIRAATPDGR